MFKRPLYSSFEKKNFFRIFFFFCWRSYRIFLVPLYTPLSVNVKFEVISCLFEASIYNFFRLTWFHSIANPILYGFMLKGFRRRARRTFSVAMVSAKTMIGRRKQSSATSYMTESEHVNSDTRPLTKWKSSAKILILLVSLLPIITQPSNYLPWNKYSRY